MHSLKGQTVNRRERAHDRERDETEEEKASPGRDLKGEGKLN